MWLVAVVLVFLLAGSATPAFSQSGDYQSGPSAPLVWQTGSAPLPPSRQQPDAQPNPLSLPPSEKSGASGWPNWYPPAPAYSFAGGTLNTGITLGTYFDDNVFATHTNRLSDWAVVARPVFGWNAQGKNFTVAVDGFIEAVDHANFTSENQVNGSVGAGFTVMPDPNTQLVGTARYIHEHLDRGESETVAPGGVLLSTLFSHPVAYDEGLASAALNKRYSQWWTSLGIAGLGINYRNADLPGSAVDFSYADGAIGVVNARLGYAFMPLTSIFIEAAANTRDWEVSAFDSNGYRLVGGVLLEQGPGARIKGELWGGYMNQQYAGASFQNVSTWTYGAGLAFLLADNLTVVMEGKREAKEAALTLGTTAPGVLGANATVCAPISGTAACVSDIETTAGGRLDLRLLPDVVVSGGATFLQDTYLGPAAGNRVDDTVSPRASLKYFPNDHMTVSFDYRYVDFSPTGGQSAGVGALFYYRNVYLVSIAGRF
jgi:opacity protein-like surface antigen